MEQIESAVEESARAKWSRIIDQQRTSGQPVAVFCRERSLPVSSYYGWRRKLGGGPVDSGFIEAQIVGAPEVGDKKRGDGGENVSSSSGVSIELSDGTRVLLSRRFDRQVLLEVIEALARIVPVAGRAS
jgi:hypothetical protein